MKKLLYKAMIEIKGTSKMFSVICNFLEEKSKKEIC